MRLKRTIEKNAYNILRNVLKQKMRVIYIRKFKNMVRLSGRDLKNAY